MTFGAMAMNDRRGHGKLRLTSRKYFKPKPKRSTVTSDPVVPAAPVSLNVALPLSAFTDVPVVSTDILHNSRCDNLLLFYM